MFASYDYHYVREMLPGQKKLVNEWLNKAFRREYDTRSDWWGRVRDMYMSLIWLEKALLDQEEYTGQFKKVGCPLEHLGQLRRTINRHGWFLEGASPHYRVYDPMYNAVVNGLVAIEARVREVHALHEHAALELARAASADNHASDVWPDGPRPAPPPEAFSERLGWMCMQVVLLWV